MFGRLVEGVRGMTTGEARELLAYGSWANARMFDAASALSEELLNHSVASSFPSVLATLAHIAGAEWVWLRRWVGESPNGFPDWVTKPVLADVRARLGAIEQERDAFVSGLSDADLGRSVAYQTLSSQPSSDRLGDLLRHVVNHSTYHRGQVATQLRQLGLKPPSTDFIVFLRQAK